MKVLFLFKLEILIAKQLCSVLIDLQKERIAHLVFDLDSIYISKRSIVKLTNFGYGVELLGSNEKRIVIDS